MKPLLVWAALALVADCGGDPPNVGANCAANADCDDGLSCNTVATGGYCTVACTMPGAVDNCPENAICDAVAGAATECVHICKTSADCRSDQDCNGITSSNIKACKPK